MRFSVQVTFACPDEYIGGGDRCSRFLRMTSECVLPHRDESLSPGVWVYRLSSGSVSTSDQQAFDPYPKILKPWGWGVLVPTEPSESCLGMLIH